MARKDHASKDSTAKVDRRKFLKGVAVAGAAGAVTPQAANAASTSGAATARIPSALPPTAWTIAAETNTPPIRLRSFCGVLVSAAWPAPTSWST